MDLYLMIRNETIKNNKEKLNKTQSKKYKKNNDIKINQKDLLRDEFIKFQWPWIL